MNRGGTTLCAAFAAAGIATTMLGPLMPGFQARWRIGDERSGLLFTAQFLASVCVAAAVGPLARRFGYFHLIRLGLVLVAAGVAGCAECSWPAALLCVGIYGCGLGLIVPAGNLGMAALHPGAGARPVMILNLSWCVGAVAAPILIAYLPGSFLWIQAAFALGLAALCGSGARTAQSVEKRQTARLGSLPHLLTALLLFLYVGSESAIGGWVALLTLRSFGAQKLWSILPSIFWAGMLAGRMLAPALLAIVRPSVLVIAGLAGAFAAVALLVAGNASAWSIAAAALSGFGLAPVFPLVVTQYAEAVARGSASGLIFSAGGLGGAVLPALVGFISQYCGSLRAGMIVVLLCVAAILWLQLWLVRVYASARTEEQH